jgi:hypothetical protein
VLDVHPKHRRRVAPPVALLLVLLAVLAGCGGQTSSGKARVTMSSTSRTPLTKFRKGQTAVHTYTYDTGKLPAKARSSTAGTQKGQTAVHTYTYDTGKLPAKASVERYSRVEDGRLVPCSEEHSEQCFSQSTLDAAAARHH